MRLAWNVIKAIEQHPDTGYARNSCPYRKLHNFHLIVYCFVSPKELEK